VIRDEGQGGFSLLEVLAGFLLLSLALTALYRAMSVSFNGMRVSREREASVMHGVTMLEWARSSQENVELAGRYPSGAQWRVRSEPIGLPPRSARSVGQSSWLIFEVTSGGKTQLRLRTMRYR
jgi:type II secretory pathway pseudopilin PulG